MVHSRPVSGMVPVEGLCVYMCVYACMCIDMHVCACVYMHTCASDSLQGHVQECPKWGDRALCLGSLFKDSSSQSELGQRKRQKGATTWSWGGIFAIFPFPWPLLVMLLEFSPPFSLPSFSNPAPLRAWLICAFGF